MDTEVKMVWVTKYALTTGIFTTPGSVNDDGTMFSYRMPNAQYTEYAHGKDWHLTREAAVARADEMRKKKIASLQKTIKKLTDMEFT